MFVLLLATIVIRDDNHQAEKLLAQHQLSVNLLNCLEISLI